jgi:hypothetical protein
MFEFYITVDKDNLSKFFEAFFEEKDGSMIKSSSYDYGEHHITAVGSEKTYRRLLQLSGNVIRSLEHFEED